MDILFFTQVIAATFFGNAAFAAIVWLWWHTRKSDQRGDGAEGIPSLPLFVGLAVLAFIAVPVYLL